MPWRSFVVRPPAMSMGSHWSPMPATSVLASPALGSLRPLPSASSAYRCNDLAVHQLWWLGRQDELGDRAWSCGLPLEPPAFRTRKMRLEDINLLDRDVFARGVP